MGYQKYKHMQNADVPPWGIFSERATVTPFFSLINCQNLEFSDETIAIMVVQSTSKRNPEIAILFLLVIKVELIFL